MYSTGYVCLIKVDASGGMLWEKNFWPGFDGRVKSIGVTPDGYILAGTSNRSLFLMNFDRDGNLAWDRTYGPGNLDPGRVLATQDGGYIVAGGPGFGSTGKMFLMKTDAGGNLSWINNYGSGYAGGLDIIEDRAGGYMIAGHNSTVNTMVFDQYPGSDVYVVRTDVYGNAIWEKTYKISSDVDYANAIVQMDDGGYAITGLSVATRDGLYVIDSDAFVLRLDKNGVRQWVKTFGSPGRAQGTALVKCDDGTLVLAGERANSDILLIKTSDAPDARAPLEDAVKPIERTLSHNPQILYCITPLFLVTFIAFAFILISVKRSIEKGKKKP
jgi:hypothetical protein